MSQKIAQHSQEKLEQLIRETQDRSESEKIVEELTKFYTKELIELVNSPSSQSVIESTNINKVNHKVKNDNIQNGRQQTFIKHNNHWC